MGLSACAGPGGAGGAQDAQSAQGAQGAATGATAETAAAEEPAGNEKPDLVIMGQEASNYSRAAESKKSVDVDVKTSALFAANDFPNCRTKIIQSWSTLSGLIWKAITELPQTT